MVSGLSINEIAGLHQEVFLWYLSQEKSTLNIPPEFRKLRRIFHSDLSAHDNKEIIIIIVV